MKAMIKMRWLGLVGLVTGLMAMQAVAGVNPPVQPDALWLKAGTGTSYRVSDGKLLWYNMETNNLDKKFNGNGYPTNLTAYSQIVTNALNGNTVIFTTNNAISYEWAFSAAPAVSNIFGAGGTVFYVFNPSTAINSGARRLLNTCQQSTTGWELLYNPGTSKIEFIHHFNSGSQNGDWQSAAVFGLGANHLLTLTYDNRDIANVPTFYLNGSPVTIANNHNPASGPACGEVNGYIRVASRGGGATEQYCGNIAEIIIYRRVLTESERHGVEVYLADKYGLNVPRYATVMSAE